MDRPVVDPTDLYRLPWTLSDNGITWLEPTSQCNLHCYGCYRKNIKNSHKPLDEVKHELDFFQAMRKTDCVSIAGGDPLLYPDIVPLVADIRRRGLKPIINTNGIALTPELLHELKQAGVFGFTFHIDSRQGQGRGKEWLGRNELELNELRLHYARMVAAEGGIACSFNATVYGDTVQYVPALVEWAHAHIDIVHTMVFILFRQVTPETPFDFYAGDEKVDMTDIHYHTEKPEVTDLMAPDIVARIRETYPDFMPAAYLNGTQRPDHFKWLLTERIGTKDQIFGYAGKKFLELVMTFYHYRYDRYISYASPGTLRLGRATLLAAWGLDRGLRRAFGKYLSYVAANPARLFRKVHLQSIMIIQPVDVMPNGDQSMCDGCPDITYWKDPEGRERLVWSCRLEELVNHGQFLRMVARKEADVPKEVPVQEREEQYARVLQPR